jgi:hypothetical protein
VNDFQQQLALLVRHFQYFFSELLVEFGRRGFNASEHLSHVVLCEARLRVGGYTTTGQQKSRE